MSQKPDVSKRIRAPLVHTMLMAVPISSMHISRSTLAIGLQIQRVRSHSPLHLHLLTNTRVQGHKQVRTSMPLDVAAVIRGMSWFEDGTGGAELARRVCQPRHECQLSGWELHTALETMDMMLAPLMVKVEDGSEGAPATGAHLTHGLWWHGARATPAVCGAAAGTPCCS